MAAGVRSEADEPKGKKAKALCGDAVRPLLRALVLGAHAPPWQEPATPCSFHS